MATNFGGVHVGCHYWVPCWGAIAGCHCLALWDGMAGCHCCAPLLVLATNFGGVHVGCHCWLPLLGCHCWLPLLGVPLLGAMQGCCWAPLLGAMLGSLLGAIADCWGAIAGRRAGVLLGAIAGVPLLGTIARKIDHSVTPFSAAPFL